MTSERLIPSRQAQAALLAFILASALCGGLVLVRAAYRQEFVFGAFLWNLFLAWVPVIAAVSAYALRARNAQPPLITTALWIVWFLFFPNAPYIITDLVHLHERPGVPFWYDLITIMAFALTGLFLGYLSLYLMQEIVRSRFGRMTSWAFALVMLGLSAFGIYLGRFLRWNSWDVLLSPIDTLSNAARIAYLDPNPRVWAFSLTFFAFSLVCYLIVYSFTHLHAWVERAPVIRPPNAG
ncbi:MAG TPA: DUF1361 domain-containing protein [Chthoniobacteraceae bacterium]|nr:DUF1361 domain-containing protein [Chthoniobacteraceae bacterium]